MKQVLATGLAVALWAGAASAAEADLAKIEACMRANIPQTLQIKEVELVAVDRGGGTRSLSGRFYGSREDEQLRTMVKISAPADLAGAAYLLRERKSGDEMYVYVPALNKVRRVTGAGVDGALWGTDLSYGDVKQINNAFSGGKTRLMGAGTLKGRPTWQLQLIPDPAQASRFSSVQAWVDQKTCVTLQAEFMEGSTARKRLSIEPKDLKQSGGHWYPAAALMTDLKENTQTRLKVVGVSSGVDLAGRLFNPSTFYVGN